MDSRLLTDEQGEERIQESFASDLCVMDKLEEAEIDGEMLLGNPPVRSQPRTQQGPESFDRGFIEAMLDAVLAATERTAHPVGPAQLSDFFEATRIVDEILNIDQSHTAAVVGIHVAFLRGFSPRQPYANVSVLSNRACD